MGDTYDSDFIEEDPHLHFMEASVTSAAFLARVADALKQSVSSLCIETVNLDCLPIVVIDLQGD